MKYAPHRLQLIPFTGGIVFPIYAFFAPESFGHWLGVMVAAFRAAAHI